MKKIIMLLALCMMCLFSFVVNAEENKADNPMNWEISMMPKPTEEEIEAARWSIVLENNMGVYAYDMDSLHFEEVKNGVVDKNIVNVASNTYGVKQMEVYGSKGTKLESKINNGELVPVPEKTFAEAMLEICTQAVKNTDDTVNNK